MLSRIGATSYRCFSQLDVALPQHAIFAGSNGIGKSTLLDIPVLLADVLRSGLRSALLEPLRAGHGPRAQRYRDILHRGRGDGCTLLLEAVLPQKVRDAHLSVLPQRWRSRPPTHLRYELQLRLVSDDELVIESEFLDLVPEAGQTQRRDELTDPQAHGWRTVIERQQGVPPRTQAEFRREKRSLDTLSPDRLALSSLQDLVLYPAASWFVNFLQHGTVSYSPDCIQLRQASPPGPEEVFRGDATLVPVQALHLTEAKREEWVHMVQLALPSVLNVEALRRAEDHYVYLKVTYRFGDDSSPDHEVTSSGLSDGTLRILAFTILPYLPKLPPLINIEEPEDGIHPRALDVVLDSLTALPDSQTFITTHSPLVLARTPLSDVICLCRDRDGAAVAVRGTDHPRLRDWKQELDLGALFAAGVLS